MDPESAENAAEVKDGEQAGAGQDGDDEEGLGGALSEDSVSAGVGTSECGSDDEGRNASERGERLAAAWGRALRRLRPDHAIFELSALPNERRTLVGDAQGRWGGGVFPGSP